MRMMTKIIGSGLKMSLIKFILIVFAFITLNTCTKRQKNKLPEFSVIKKEEVFEFRQGSLNYQYGIPVLELYGSPYEMGVQYGVLLRKEIISLNQHINDLKKVYVAQQPFYIRMFSGIYTYQKLKSIKKRLPKEYIDELKGISHGSGVELEDILLINFSGSLIQGRCTSIIMKEKTGNIIHGRNFDLLPYFLSDYFAIIRYNPEKGVPFTNFTIASYVGSFQGINDNGIAITLNYGEGAYDKKFEGLPISFKIRYLLENSKNMKELDQKLVELKSDEPGSILAISSPKDNTASIYDIFSDNISRQELDSKKIIFAFNSIFNPFRTKTVSLSKQYLNINVGLFSNNIARQDRLQYLLKNKYNNKKYTFKSLLEILSDTDFYSYENFYGSGHYMTISNEFTLFNIVFDYSNNAVYFGKAPAYSANSAIYKMTLNDNIVTLHREASPIFKSEELQRFVSWQNKTQVLQVKKKYKKIAKYLAVHDNLTPKEITTAYLLYMKNKDYIEKNKVLKMIDVGIKRYPDYYLFPYIKGRIFEENKNYEKAATQYEISLKKKILFPYSELSINYKLYEMYKKMHRDRRKKRAKAEFKKIYEKYEKTYKISKDMKKKYNKLK